MPEMSLERRVQYAPALNFPPLDYSTAKYFPMGAVYIDKEGKSNVAQSDRPAVHEYQARQMDDIVKEYVRSEAGRSFLDYAASHGHKSIQLVGTGAADLGQDAVAAVIHDGKRGIMVSNYDGKDFHSRVQEFADNYGLRHKEALEYVLTHEFGHVAGYNTEAGNEGFIKEYFMHRANQTQGGEQQKYMQLAQVAGHREQEAQKGEYTKNP